MIYNDFLDYDRDYKDAKFILIPAPMEATVSYGHGTSLGPAALLESSTQLETYDIELDSEAVCKGVHTFDAVEQAGLSPEEYLNRLREKVSSCAKDKKIPVVIGGEHSLSYAVFQGISDHNKGFSILHFDAHLDLRDSYSGSKYSHASVIRRMRDHRKDFDKISAVGIRSVCPEEAAYLKEHPDHKVFYAHQLNGKDLSSQIADTLSEDIYITFDVDALDPSIMPSTGTPEPGGLGWYQTLDILRKSIKGRRVLGIDIVELAPDKVNHYSQFTAAKLLYKMLAYTIAYGKN